jgi:purine-binding chemotaxis protein CheW
MTERPMQLSHSALGDNVDAAAQEWLEIAVSGARCGIPLPRVREIVVPKSITRIPNSRSSIAGVTSVRGRLITVFDARSIIGEAVCAPTSKLRIVVVREGSEEIGIRADAVFGVVRLHASECESPQVLGGRERPYLSGIGRKLGRAIQLLNPTTLFGMK